MAIHRSTSPAVILYHPGDRQTAIEVGVTTRKSGPERFRDQTSQRARRPETGAPRGTLPGSGGPGEQTVDSRWPRWPTPERQETITSAILIPLGFVCDIFRQSHLPECW